jgi:solute carrier family 34 (sodium-dependent phosphate cotransporter)
VTGAATRPGRDDPGLSPAVRAVVVVALLYLFLVGVSLLEDGIGALGEGVHENLLTSVENPLAGLFVGILATVLVQSSSVTTATIVGMVGAGLLGIDDATPMIMGANLGTTVTNTLASLGHVRRPAEFRLAFAAATVHDFFNLLAVAILLPLELATGFLSSAAEWLAEQVLGRGSGATFNSPIKAAVQHPAGLVDDLWSAVGADGTVLGALLIATGLASIFTALTFITKNMRVLVASRVERSINAILSRGGGTAAILLGAVITVSVQSSSIATAILIPLAASGILSLASCYPITLGANVGTTITALLASLATNRPEALTVALVHTLFNVSGIVLFYPVPAMRRIPMRMAEWMAELAITRRSAVVAYVVGTFLVIPAVGVLVLR